MENLNTLQANETELHNILTSPKRLKSFLNENSLSLKKYLGQNFLFDKNIILKIVDKLNLNPNDIVLEIGPGIGNVTFFYFSNVKHLILVEKDKGFVRILNRYFSKPNIEIIHSDFLKLDLKFLKDFKDLKLFSNLPYKVASQIIFKIIENVNLFSEIYLMVPEILYDRMVAKENSKDYTRFTLFFQSFVNVEKLFKVNRNSFYPVPEIDSVFIKIIPRQIPLIPFNKKEEFKKFLSKIFKSRRKKLKNILSGEFSDFRNIDIDLNKRIEEIPLEKIIELFKNF